MKTSVMGAINVLGMAKRCRAKVLQASTSEVYGDPEVHPQTEDYWGNVNPIGPRAVYDEAKRFAEAMTIFAVICALVFPGIHVGRVWAAYWMLPIPNQMAMWPGGSDNANDPNTRALPAIWENFPDVGAKAGALVEAATAMEAAAGEGLDALRGAMGPLGGACAACHESYRAPAN